MRCLPKLKKKGWNAIREKRIRIHPLLKWSMWVDNRKRRFDAQPYTRNHFKFDTGGMPCQEFEKECVMCQMGKLWQEVQEGKGLTYGQFHAELDAVMRGK
jgi:hypothetical protein